MNVNLTPREREVLLLTVTQLYATYTINAEALGISVKTLEKHRMSLAKKTRTHTLSELLVWALRNHLITLNDVVTTSDKYPHN